MLQTSPPIERPQRIHRQLAHIDYLVGTEWTLRKLMADYDPSIDEVARTLLTLDVTTICVVENLTCLIRSRELDADISAPPVPLTDTQGASEAFSAALVHQLLRTGRSLTHETLQWVCAAMAGTPSVDIPTDTMPTPDNLARRHVADDKP